MKKYIISFNGIVNQVRKDAMLFVALFAPILAGFFIKFGIPYVEKIVTNYFHKQTILADYYLLFDLLLAVIAPIMVGFIGAMVVLGEIDDSITKYIAVTPLGKKGYLITRFVMPTGISFLGSIVTVTIFSLTHPTFLTIFVFSFYSAIMGIIIGLFIVTLSTNKVEGMAIGKLSGIIIIGMFVPIFITTKNQYLAAILPSFWLGKYIEDMKISWIFLGMAVSILWINLLYKKFMKKLW